MKIRHFAAGSMALLLLAAPAAAVPTTLASISRLPVSIANANVRDTNGRIIGAVQRVDISAQCTPTKVSIALLGPGEKMAVLNAGQVQYDPARSEIITDSARGQPHMLYGQN